MSKLALLEPVIRKKIEESDFCLAAAFRWTVGAWGQRTGPSSGWWPARVLHPSNADNIGGKNHDGEFLIQFLGSSPSDQATEFILNEYKDRKITKTSFMDSSFCKNLEFGLRFGNPLLVQDVENYGHIFSILSLTESSGRRVVEC